MMWIRFPTVAGISLFATVSKPTQPPAWKVPVFFIRDIAAGSWSPPVIPIWCPMSGMHGVLLPHPLIRLHGVVIRHRSN